MTPGVQGLGHINLRANADLIERLRRFYIDVIGLKEGPRPTFRSGSKGFWLYAGETAVVHLSIDRDGDASPLATGHFNHIAFDCTGLDATRTRLDDWSIPYSTSIVDERHQVQLFLTDPAGLRIELTFTTPSCTP
ncbi:MAG TPA: VOC family protein [Oleiagrimonas sp.]|nr:VOC family protein [Oleiagrimonas sp.]